MSGQSDEASGDDLTGSRSQRRSLIVQRAADVFFDKGYDGASIQDVADAVGILKGSLYHHISSKQELLADIVTEVHEQLLAALTDVDGDASPAVRLRQMVLAHMRYTGANRTKVGVAAREFGALESTRVHGVGRQRRRYEQAFVDVIVDGRDSTVFRDDLDVEVAAKGVLGMLSYVPGWLEPDGDLTPVEVGEQLATLIVDGLSVRP